jgi:hypothetical protein
LRGLLHGLALARSDPGMRLSLIRWKLERLRQGVGWL